MLAAKASLAARVDALGEDSNCDLGMQTRAKVEARLRVLEDGQVSRLLIPGICYLYITLCTIKYMYKMSIDRQLPPVQYMYSTA